jgi:hypothetical protein
MAVPWSAGELLPHDVYCIQYTCMLDACRLTVATVPPR